MACTRTPTATRFRTTGVPTFGLSTSVVTQVRSTAVARVIRFTTCVPTVVASNTTCVPTVITSTSTTVGLVTSRITSVRTVSRVETITSPTQTLFSTSCPHKSTTKTKTKTKTTTLPPSETPTSTSTIGRVLPVTLTRTLTSTDPSGNIVLATILVESTPLPNPTQSDAGSGGPNTTAIVGGVVGGLVGLIALFGIIWYITHKKLGGCWNNIREGDEGHQAGAAEVKQERPAVSDDGSSPNRFVYGVVGRGTPSVHSQSRSVSMASGYADHGRPNSQTLLMSTTSPPHPPPTFPPSLQPSQLPGAGAGLQRMRTPIWANPSAQQVQQGYPHIPSDTYSTTSTSRTTSGTESSTQWLLSGYAAPTHTAATPVAAYPLGAAAPMIGGRHTTYNEYYKPPLEQAQQAQGLLSSYVAPIHTAATLAVAYPPGAAAPMIGGRGSTYYNEDHKPPPGATAPMIGGRGSMYNEYYNPPLEQSRPAAALPQHQQTAASVGTTNFVDASIDNSAKSRTGLGPVAPGPLKTSNPAPIVEDGPPAQGLPAVTMHVETPPYSRIWVK